MLSSAVTVYIVDDDVRVCRALGRLIRAAGYHVSAFGSAAEFLAANDPDAGGCVILDVAMPGISGLDVQRILNQSGRYRPVIFLTGAGNIQMSVQAMKAGAVTFLTKPVAGRELVSVVNEALSLDRLWRRNRGVQKRMATLTPREKEVLKHVIAGCLNKQIAAFLGTVEQTVKVHRARVMSKMGAKSLAELIRFAACAEAEAGKCTPPGACRELV